MTALNKQALRQTAEKAISEEGLTWWSEEQLASDYGLALHRADAAFIAAANPVTMLALLDELEAKDIALSSKDYHFDQDADRIKSLEKALEAAEKRIAELEAREVKPVAWMRNANVTSFMSRFTTDENYAVEQWGDDAVALYSLPVDFIPACFTDERNLMYINERGRETSLIWSERNSEDGDIQLFRAAGIGVKGE